MTLAYISFDPNLDFSQTHPGQLNSDETTRIHDRSVAAQLRDFADDANGAVGELFEVLGVDAGGCFVHCCEFDWLRVLIRESDILLRRIADL